MQPTDCWFLTGPTASGKTGVGLELASLLGAEIVSLDSMAVYRGLDIGTAKPSRHQRQVVPHHLIDVVDPTEEFSLARYVEAAGRAVERITQRGRVGLFVGGTPLYLKALLRGIFSGPQADWELRRQLLAEAEREGTGALHARLAAVDPLSAARLHPGDTRRVIRAIEVWQKTGQSITQLQQQFDKARPARSCRVFVLAWPREELDRRINQRVDAMFAGGLIEETGRLMQTYSALSRSASQALGYREVIEHLRGERTREEAIELVKLRTRQFAKRQMTWFRGLSECRFIPMSVNFEPANVALRIQDHHAM